ncbi:MAG: hypothetical protein ACE5L6_07520 [Candidatus Bathyarchaeia archaeon]
MISKGELVLIRRKAWRKRIWFKGLNRVERGLVSLTIRCVDRVQSSKLTAMLKNIVERLKEMLRSGVDRLMEEIGWSLARKLAYLAVSWGNQDALNWAFDARFAKHLAVMHMNSPEMCNA